MINIKGGFDSKPSKGGIFSFYMKEILNPFTTKMTASFKIMIFDAGNGKMYINAHDYTVQACPSLFSYAYAESTSSVVSVSSR